MTNSGTLTATTPSDREIVLTRIFDAPRRMVFQAFTHTELLKLWFGPRGWWLIACDRGVYIEITPPERSVHTESYDDIPGESRVTTVLAEHGGKTTLTATILYPSRDARDGVINAGMEHGAAETYDQLAEMFAAGVRAR